MSLETIYYKKEIQAIINGIVHHAVLEHQAQTQIEKDAAQTTQNSYRESLWFWIKKEIDHVHELYR